VSDPRAPEWLPYTAGFERWWDLILASQMAKIEIEKGGSGSGSNNDPSLVPTLTPEHGPPNYQQTLPYTGQPIADIQEINPWIAGRVKKRFEQKFGLVQ
jgi:hypothetical protein